MARTGSTTSDYLIPRLDMGGFFPVWASRMAFHPPDVQFWRGDILRHALKVYELM